MGEKEGKFALATFFIGFELFLDNVSSSLSLTSSCEKNSPRVKIGAKGGKSRTIGKYR